MRIKLPAVLAAFCLFAVACGSGGATESGFQVSGEDLVPTETTTSTAPPPSHEVTVATAVVPEIQASCLPPAGIDATTDTTEPLATETTEPPASECPEAPAVEGQAVLTAIPGPVDNATSGKIDGGWKFFNPTYFGNPLTFLVTEDHGEWLQVMVPTRPNHQEGWVRAADVETSTHEYRAEINVSQNSMQVWNGEELVVETGIVDGKETSPTPIGTFYFNEKIEKTPTGPYGSWILSTNAYSDSLETFDGGLPVFAVHGTNDPSQIGSDISNGCVRVPNDIVEQMANEVPMGTPITVVV